MLTPVKYHIFPEAVNMKNKEYYLGLDCGTDSVGYAATDTQYNLLKFKGEPMMGVTTFDAASLSDERRTNRTNRRRLHRKQHRVQLLQELFAAPINAVDPQFFTRIRESDLWREDKSINGAEGVYFNDADFSEKDYYKKHPTIHHLICELMTSAEPHDVRLVYIACAWLVAHRGHFLSPVSEDNVQAATDISGAYADFMNWFEGEKPWYCDIDEFADILKSKIRISDKEKLFNKLLFAGKKPMNLVFDEEDASAPILSRSAMIKLLCGGKVAPKDLFLHKSEEYTEISSFALGGKEEDLALILSQLGDDAELIQLMKALFDWAVLTDVLHGEHFISQAKVKTFDQHKADLVYLKAFIKKYLPDKYDEVFSSTTPGNYLNYAHHASSKDAIPTKQASKTDFCDYIKKLVKDIPVKSADQSAYDDMMARLESYSFMPKQKDTDNRVIPYQLYAVELRQILKNAEQYLPFLCVKDSDGLTVSDKIISVFRFRIPYYVGPLNSRSSHAWLERKAGKIYPWNFESMVDLDESENAFIRNMTGNCTYLPSEKVLPKNSLCYTKFTVLNEINPLKINNLPITPEQKQAIYCELFENRKRVTFKGLKGFCISEGYMTENDTLTGIDSEGIKSSLQPWFSFRRLMESGKLSEEQAEQIIERITCTEDKPRLIRWLETSFPTISPEDISYLSKLKFKDFGRLSHRFLCELEGMEKSTGQMFTILQAMWETNHTLMELLSDKFTFSENIREELNEYYKANPHTLAQRMDVLYLSNTVRRQIYRTLDVVKDVVKAAGSPPSKIFVEMARGANEDQKGKRTKSRKVQIQEYYKKIAAAEVREVKELLETKDDNALQSEKLYLYFMQLGRCMYSGAPIDIEHLGDQKLYDVDHIFPQCKVKDDSILNNKVLCRSECNGKKGDKYPIEVDIQSKMSGFWAKLHANGLITDEKYRRLTRTTGFTADEQMDFIQRQLVETRQSTKAVATILKERYPETEIVYVKAGLVSDFRNEFDMLKSRTVNDLHHAKDAYLNVVVGNVYHERFNKNFFRLDQEYSMKTKQLFSYPIRVNGRYVWNGSPDIGRVKAIAQKNNAHVTRFAFCKHGQLFDSLRRANPNGNLIPRKVSLPSEKYGGFERVAASFFVLVKYTAGKKSGLMIAPIDLMAISDYEKDAAAVAKAAVERVLGKTIDSISLPLGTRRLKVNTILSLDGFRVALSGKSSGGKALLVSPLMPLRVDADTERYIKRIESFRNKKKENPQIKLNAQYDKITPEDNIKLYDLLTAKLTSYPFNKRPAVSSVSDVLIKGKKKFADLAPNVQIDVLAEILIVFSRNGGGSNLTLISGAGGAGAPTLSSNISNWKKVYSDVRIIDQSPSGLYEKESINLLTLL